MDRVFLAFFVPAMVCGRLITLPFLNMVEVGMLIRDRRFRFGACGSVDALDNVLRGDVA